MKPSELKMENKSVLLLWALVFGNILLQAESALKITFIEDLCYNAKKSVIDLRYDSSGILMSAPSMNAPDSFECEVLLRPPPGSSVVLSIFRYDLRDGDQLVIEDSDRHRIALMGWGSFKYEKKSVISDGKMTVLYKTNNNTSTLRRTGFQFTYTKVMNSPCSSNEFKCDNGKCVLKEYICDGHNHCGDRSDQTKCDSIRTRLVPKVDNNGVKQWSSRDPTALWVTLIGIATAIVLIVIFVSIAVLVRRIKQKKTDNGSTVNTSSGNDVPLQNVSSTVPLQVSQTAPSTISTTQNLDNQAVTTNNPAHGNPLYNRVHRSFRGTRSEPRVENIPQERSAPEQIQVPSMYPSLDQIPSAPDIHREENSNRL